MKNNRIIYSLNQDDIQMVAIQELERTLSLDEIKQIIPSIESNINWYETIANSITEIIVSNDKRDIETFK